MARILNVGIDVGSRRNRAQFVDDHEVEHGRLTFANDAGGAVRLVAETCRKATKLGTDTLRFGLEATGFYGWHLALYLVRCPELTPWESTVYLFNPRVIHGFKKTYTDLPKTDWVDAWVVAERLRIGRLPRPFTFDERYLPLQRLTRHRYFLVKQLARNKNYFLGYLFLKCNRLATASPLSDPLGATGSALVTEYYSVEDIAAASLEELTQFLIDKSLNKFYDPYDVAKALQATIKHAYRLPDVLRDPVNRILASTLQVIRELEREIKQTTEAIERELRGFNNVLRSIPGMGPVFSAGILAEIGNIENFPDNDALAKFAGLTWRNNDSAEFEGDDRPLTRTGNAYLRYYLVEAANSIRQNVPEYQAFYQRKYHEVTRHRHKRALTMTARKLTRLVFALLRDQRVYSESERRTAART